jgi:hypothetical protein
MCEPFQGGPMPSCQILSKCVEVCGNVNRTAHTRTHTQLLSTSCVRFSGHVLVIEVQVSWLKSTVFVFQRHVVSQIAWCFGGKHLLRHQVRKVGQVRNKLSETRVDSQAWKKLGELLARGWERASVWPAPPPWRWRWHVPALLLTVTGVRTSSRTVTSLATVITLWSLQRVGMWVVLPAFQRHMLPPSSGSMQRRDSRVDSYKCKVIPVTGCRGSWGCETSSLPHSSNQPAHRWRWGQPYAPAGRPPFTPRKIPGTHFC